MKGKATKRLVAFAAAALVCVPAALADPKTQAADYEVIDLGTLGGSASVSLGINNNGQVVGGSTTPGDTLIHAFVAQRSGGGTVVEDVGRLFGGTHSQALAINANGDIAAATVSGGHMNAVLYTGKVKLLGTLGGQSSVARGLNNRGDVVGYSALVGDGAAHAFLFTRGSLLDLGTLGGTNSAAFGINNRGDVVGNSETGTPNITHAFLYTGSMRSLGTLGGSNSFAVAINSSGKVVGSANKADGTTHGFLFAGPDMEDLGTLGGDSSDAFDINDRGDIVGRSMFARGETTTHAFLLGKCGMTDLNGLIPADSGWVLNEARAINNAGEIAGIGQRNGQTHSFLLSPKNNGKGKCSNDEGDEQ